MKQENIQNLLKLIQENPELPIVAMVDGEVVGGDEYGYWVGKFGKARVDEYLMPRDGREDDGIYFKSDDDVYDVLERYLPEEEWEALPESVDECRPRYDALPWVKAIIVYIELPDMEEKNG